jgi:hypothetical protein
MLIMRAGGSFQLMAIQVIMNQQPGPLPLKVAFKTPSDGPATIIVHGTIWSQTANVMIGVDVLLDGTKIGSASIFSNLQATHRAFPATYIPVKLAFGEHTLTLSVSAGAGITDLNDRFTAVLDY